MSDLTFEVTEFFQDRQQRFEAALLFTKEGILLGHGYEAAVDRGVELADYLIKKLNETEKEDE